MRFWLRRLFQGCSRDGVNRSAPRDAPPTDRPPPTQAQPRRGPQVSGVWDAVTSATIDEGVAAGDVRIEKQEWHLSQSGSAIRGYYIAALTLCFR